MNKKELVDAMAEAAGINKSDAEKALNGMLMAVTNALSKGDKVTLVSEPSLRPNVPHGKQKIRKPVSR